MKTLKLNSSGDLVEKWQYFLRGQGYLINVTGYFDIDTEEVTKQFQKKYKLTVDGIVGNQTFGKAGLLGFLLVEYDQEANPVFPQKPDFKPILNHVSRQQQFGPLEFISAPTKSNPEAIKITNNFAKDKIVKVLIPQLIGVLGAPSDGHIYFHISAKEQLIALWDKWDREGLLSNILTFDGSFVPRLMRGKALQGILSNHAFGTAFDINAKWNSYGAQPATSIQNGCVYELVKIANDFGFYWGGHFNKPDGMHFEIARFL